MMLEMISAARLEELHLLWLFCPWTEAEVKLAEEAEDG